ncbi:MULTISPECIES: MarR family winged helix-turn-helix transcriptional regulator [unclassified Ruegeria]|uniref:MarR family winged helix-turn-helix transcriptional regulator n=1 Tax=unclassified Ruegeria TaxID=2625375 RepID=UPI0020C5427E|nr:MULTISPECIES: MarR family transcriptional regulator [unclassified Ruegeria]
MSESETKYRLSEQVGYLLRLASQRHAVIFQSRVSEGLTPTQFATLIRVAETGEVSQNQLGRLAAMDIATIKGVVDRLKSKGLLQSASDPHDKRRSIISLTSNGAALMDQLYADGLSISDETLAPLDTAERETLLQLLKKIS